MQFTLTIPMLTTEIHMGNCIVLQNAEVAPCYHVCLHPLSINIGQCCGVEFHTMKKTTLMSRGALLGPGHFFFLFCSTSKFKKIVAVYTEQMKIIILLDLL